MGTRRNRNGSHMTAVICMSVIIILSIIVSGCSSAGDEASSSKGCETVKLHVETVSTDQGENAFSISLEDFIRSFNSFYKAEKGDKYLGEAGQWMMYASCYVYSEDPDSRVFPQIMIYADSPVSEIYQISLCYDDHSYQPATYDIYKELIFYALRTIFPDKSEEEIKALSEKMLTAVEDSFTTDKEAANHTPEMTYREDGIGIYPYYVVGELMELRIVPVSE